MFSVEMSDADAKGLQGSLVSDILSFGTFVFLEHYLLVSHIKSEPDKQVGSKALV